MFAYTPKKRKTFFPLRLDEPVPSMVIVPKDTVRPDNGTVRTFEPVPYKGPRKLVRVFPNPERPWETIYLQSLIQHDQKFAPANGDGILVAEEYIKDLPPV